MINLPIVHDKIGIRLVGYGEGEPGWITTGSRRDANRSSVGGGRADIAIEPGAGWRIDISGLAQRIHVDDSQYVYGAGTLIRPDQRPEPHVAEIAHGAVRVSGLIGAVQLEALSGYTWHHLGSALDATVGAAALAAALGVQTPLTYNDDRQFRVWESEVRLSGQVFGARWLIGASHTEAREHELRDLTYPTIPAGSTGDSTGSSTGNTGTGNSASSNEAALAALHVPQLLAASTNSETETEDPSVAVDMSQRNAFDSGLFATVDVPITRHLDVEGGARAFINLLEVQRTVVTAFGEQRTIKRGISPAGAISWHPHAGRTLFVRYGRAFRQGGLAFGEDGRVTAFAGDRLDTIEAGWREAIGKVTVNAGGFLTWWNDVQADTLESTGLVETQNVGRARIEGLELGASFGPVSGWEIDLGSTVQRARLVSNAAGMSLTNARLPMIPDYTVRASVERRFGILGGQGAIRLSLRQVGPARLSFDPKLDQPTGNVLETTLGASIKWARTCLSLAVENPLNQMGNTFAYGNPFRLATPQYTPQAPLRATMMLTYRF